MELELSILLFLLCVAFVAGFVDSIAGGGGMLTIPALLAAGIPPTYALGTNKLQASLEAFLPHSIMRGEACSTFAFCLLLSYFVRQLLGACVCSFWAMPCCQNLFHFC